MTEFFRDVPNLSYQQFSVFTKLFWEIKWESISQVKNYPAYFKSCKNFKGRLINVILFSPWYFLLLLRSMMKKELLFAWFKFKKPPFGTKGVFLQADSPAHFIFFKRKRDWWIFERRKSILITNKSISIVSFSCYVLNIYIL